MNKRPGFYWISFFAALLAPPAWSVEPFTIKNIEVEGVQRISKGTLFNYLPLQTGDQFNDFASQQALAALYKTGFFNNIEIYHDAGKIIIKVEERPSIATAVVHPPASARRLAPTEGLVWPWS